MAGWLSEHDEFLRECLASGMSSMRAADALNARFRTRYSRNAIISRANRKNMPRNRSRANIIVRKVREAKPKAPPAPKPERRTKFTAPTPIAPEPFTLRCIEIDPRHVSLIDLEPGDCRWPYGDGPFTFCGHPAVFGSYCGPHYGLSVGAGTRSEQAAGRVSRKVA